jgi:coproporphyrinogen III oxidase
MGGAKTGIIKNQEGIAMVLAVSMIALLSCIAIWLIIESKSNMQSTKAYERTEATNRLAESGCWLAVHALDVQTPALPTTGTNIQDITPSESYLTLKDLGGGMRLTPQVWSGRDFYNTLPPAGWTLNEPSRYYTRYYLGRGAGVMEISGGRGHARSIIVNFVEKVSR